MPARILVADDEAVVRAGVAALCRALGYETIEASSGAQTLARSRAERPDIVLLDLSMPEGGGLEILPKLVTLDVPPAVVVLTGATGVATAVESMRAGASDYLQKPVRLETLDAALARILKTRAVVLERDRLRGELARLRSGPILGESRAIQQVLDTLARVAATPRTTVLILGESGVGKELVARAVHERSSRAHAPFVALNCAALSAALLEAELFGYEGGSFTGAASKGREGLIAAAEGGSLFLDEIGELERDLQAKLLRVLQERVYRPVGADTDRAMDVRILASTNRDLPTMVEAGGFREDLFYRLNVMSIRVPALRERADDILVLANHFLAHFQLEFGREYDGFSPEARRRLMEHHWPGNVRELRNAIERAALLAEGGILSADHLFPPSSNERALDGRTEGRASLGERLASELAPSDRSLASIEKAWILKVLSDSAGNRSQAARVLGVNRTTLYNKLKVYGLE